MKLEVINSIKNEGEYEKALALLRILRGAKTGSKEGQYRANLKKLVLEYETIQHPFGEKGFESWAQQMQEPGVAEAKVAEIAQAEKVSETFIANWNDFIDKRKKLVKQRLKEMHSSHVKLAEKIHLDKSHLSNILSGKRALNVNVVVLMSDHLGIPVEKLLPPVEIAREIVLAE